jgi:hypothetical protein
VLLSVAVYLNAVDNPFAFDDVRRIVEKASVIDVWDRQGVIVRGAAHPVVGFSYDLDALLWRPGPFGHHVTNLLLHAANVALLFWVGLLGARRSGAMSPTVVATAAALLFAVHPVLTQAVGYVSARGEVLYATLVLLAFLGGHRWMLHGGFVWLTAGLLAWLPAILATQPEWSAGIGAVDALWRYLVLFVVPAGQSIFHPPTSIDTILSVRAIGNAAVMAVFVASAWRLRRVQPLIALGLFWFALFVIPAALAEPPVAEHRAYVPAAGLCVAAAAAFATLWARAPEQRFFVAALAVIAVLSLSWLTVTRNTLWQNPLLLAEEAVTRAPSHWMPRVLLADALRHQGRCAEAVRQYTSAVALQPFEERTYMRLARCFVELRSIPEAELVLRQLRTFNARSRDALVALGVLATIAAREAEARTHFTAVLAADPADRAAAALLALLNGTLPADARGRLCEELRLLAGETARMAACSG